MTTFEAVALTAPTEFHNVVYHTPTSFPPPIHIEFLSSPIRVVTMTMYKSHYRLVLLQ